MPTPVGVPLPQIPLSFSFQASDHLTKPFSTAHELKHILFPHKVNEQVHHLKLCPLGWFLLISDVKVTLSRAKVQRQFIFSLYPHTKLTFSWTKLNLSHVPSTGHKVPPIVATGVHWDRINVMVVDDNLAVWATGLCNLLLTSGPAHVQFQIYLFHLIRILLVTHQPYNLLGLTVRSSWRAVLVSLPLDD